MSPGPGASMGDELGCGPEPAPGIADPTAAPALSPPPDSLARPLSGHVHDARVVATVDREVRDRVAQSGSGPTPLSSPTSPALE
jgi:hypothetical protein